MGAKCCSICGKDEKSTPREFSTTAWSILLSWNEVDDANKGNPFCEDCYWGLREILIDRSKEIDSLVGSIVESPEQEKVAI